jgi:hypothetical protein
MNVRSSEAQKLSIQIMSWSLTSYALLSPCGYLTANINASGSIFLEAISILDGGNWGTTVRISSIFGAERII